MKEKNASVGSKVFADFLRVDLDQIQLTETTLKMFVESLDKANVGEKLTKQIVRSLINKILENEYYFAVFFKNEPVNIILK